MHNDMMQIGGILRRAREVKQLSQAALAEIIDGSGVKTPWNISDVSFS